MADFAFRAESARLITRASSDRTGISDYTVKRDFRRDLDQDLRREGYDYFWVNVSESFATNPGLQPFPQNDPEGDPITLIVMARRPNGEHAVVVGTKTKLWRFFGLEDGDYYEGTGSSAYMQYDNEVPENPNAYYASNASDWQLIGSGFSEGGHRWEALSTNGYLVLNNGVDLLVTYRIEEPEVVPIYELREQGIASVGTIGETNGILMCGDISEINDRDKLIEIMSHVGDIDGGDMTASQSGTTITVPAPFFSSSHVGMMFVWDDTSRGGTRITALGAIDPSTGLSKTVTVVANITRTSDRFTLRNTASQTGASFSGLITGSVGTGGPPYIVTASGAFFSAGNVGKYIRFSNGFSSQISVFTDTTHVQIAAAPPEAITDLPFWITTTEEAVSGSASYLLVADAPIFTSDMVGRYIVFDTGEIRRIEFYNSPTTVTVDSDAAIADTLFRLNNEDAYAAFTDETYINRIQYRTIWSMPDEPRRFGALVPVTIEEGSQVATPLFPVKSFEAGQEVSIIGAGASGGTLATSILMVTGLGGSFLLADSAETSVDAGEDTETDDGFITRSDAIGSIVGFEDLQDDSSGILRILALGENTLIIYKDTCMFTAFYTGDVAAPWDFKRIKLPEALTLHYRWTLCNAGGLFHVFAGANSFFRFDLATRIPQIIPALDLISDRFFSEVSLDDTDEIFAADNAITNEVFFWFPSTAQDKGIAYDYKQDSASTTTMEMTAACTVKKPMVGTLAGATTDLFLMGNSEGTILVYGKAEEAQASWGNVKEIFYRRSAFPFSSTTNGYDSVLSSGWGDFGDAGSEKDLMQYVLFLASQSPNCGLLLRLYGEVNAPNPDDAPIQTKLMDYYMPNPKRENLVPTFFRQQLYRWEITISGKNNPCRISKHSFKVDLITSENHERRP